MQVIVQHQITFTTVTLGYISYRQLWNPCWGCRPAPTCDARQAQGRHAGQVTLNRVTRKDSLLPSAQAHKSTYFHAPVSACVHMCACCGWNPVVTPRAHTVLISPASFARYCGYGVTWAPPDARDNKRECPYVMSTGTYLMFGPRDGLECTQRGKKKKARLIFDPAYFLRRHASRRPPLYHRAANQSGLRVVRDYESPKIRPRGLGIRRC